MMARAEAKEPFNVSTELPDELAFFSFFEVEPKMLEEGVSWLHNTSVYETDRDGYSVKFKISLFYSTLSVTVAVGGREVAETELSAFTSLDIVNDGGRETLIAGFGELEASAM